MPDAPADLIAALVALLKEQAGVSALVGTRVFGEEIPAEEAPEMPRAALVVTKSGGPSLTGRSTADHDVQRIDLFAYGATPFEAGRVMGHASLALRRVRRSVWADVLIHSIDSAGGATNARDPDAAWPRAFQSFQVFHALVAVN